MPYTNQVYFQRLIFISILEAAIETAKKEFHHDYEFTDTIGSIREAVDEQAHILINAVIDSRKSVKS